MAGDSPFEILKLVLSSMIWAEILGVGVAWLSLRGSGHWSERPAEERRIDVLARYVGKVTTLVGGWSLIIACSALLTSWLS